VARRRSDEADGPERIAVLGAGGFLGSHLVPALLERRDCRIDAVDVTFDKLAPSAAGRVERIQARLDQPGLLEEITSRCTVVLSLTAICTPARYNRDPLAVIDASYTDLVPLVKLCAERRRWLVHFSTCEVYGRRALDPDGRPTARMIEDETAMFLGPVHRERWSYACAKQLIERVIWAQGQHAGLPFTIVRPFNVIGPRMDFLPGIDGEGVPRVLASFIGCLMRGEPLPLVDGGGQRRSFVSVGDFSDGVVRILERPQSCRGQIFNLGNPANDVSVRTLAEALRRTYGTLVPDAVLPGLETVTAEAFYGPGYDDTPERVPDIDKAERLLDWRPATTLAVMLPDIVADYVARYTPRLRRATRVDP
jgi:UDP-apiose/xylose synthase